MRDEVGNDAGDERAAEECDGHDNDALFLSKTEIVTLQKRSRPAIAIEKGRKGLRQRTVTWLHSSDRGGSDVGVWGG
ncbi:hypothetical protein BHM03_00037720 [Ensete ventricosum]|nr:hypothetical protein BHM03_00037720 [Ensete ventricosum]